MKDLEIVIPVHTTRHYMLMDCVRNVRETAGVEPVVWESPGNVAVARNEALGQVDAEWVCFLDTDAFPQERNWHTTLLDAARNAGVQIANPFEVFDFGTHLDDRPRGTTRVVPRPENCGGFCLLVNRASCATRFDENIGYESDFLGPCLEDADFACSVGEAGGSLLLETSVTVIHRDRGVANLREFFGSHEGFCYAVVGELMRFKHHLGMPDLFEGIGKVPGVGRYLASGYGRDDLIECFAPVISKLPEAMRSPVQQHVENLALPHFI